MFLFGVVLFALGILLSVAWHECGHMWAARSTGMKVRRYFVGFGPKIWSIRRGETEYGLKAIPAGGFCDIAGMTVMDELEPGEEDRAMWKQKPWKRVFVLFAGPAMNFILGMFLLYTIAVCWGLPGMSEPEGAKITGLTCATDQLMDGSLAPCPGEGPAQRAGLKAGDVVAAVDGKAVSASSAEGLMKQLQQAAGPVRLDVLRSGQKLSFQVTPERKDRLFADSAATGGKVLKPVGVVGAGLEPTDAIMTSYNPLTAMPATFEFSGKMFEMTGDALLKMPTKVTALWHSLTGGVRDLDTPMSVVGASRIGGELAEHDSWFGFVFLLASMNFVLGIVNLLPLVPFDGGHIAVVGYEKIRDVMRRWLGKAAGGPVDYLKLAPATYAVLALVGVYMVLVLAADIVNPIRVF